MFENKIIRGIHTSRIIMSWYNAGGPIINSRKGRALFREWLQSLGFEPEDISFITNFAENGKLEYESSAEKFLRK